MERGLQKWQRKRKEWNMKASQHRNVNGRN
jgi:hypothetical protein